MPENRLRLFEAFHLNKERERVSFLYGSLSLIARIFRSRSTAGEPNTADRYDKQPTSGFNNKADDTAVKSANRIPVSICSDIIKADPHTIGSYACSEKGFMLITAPAYKKSVLSTAIAGTLLFLPTETIKPHQQEKKTHLRLVPVMFYMERRHRFDWLTAGRKRLIW